MLSRAVAKSILKIVVDAKSRANHGFRAEWTPRQSNPRLRQELCVIHGEQRISHARLRRNHSIRKRIVRGSAVRLVPAGRKLIPETYRHRKSRPYSDCALPSPPPHTYTPI